MPSKQLILYLSLAFLLGISLESISSQFEYYRLIETTTSSLPKTNISVKKQDETCQRLFEWSMIHQWEDDNHKSPLIDLKQLPDTRKLTILRSDDKDSLQMEISVYRNHSLLTIVDVRRMSKMSVPFQDNLWHRMISQYNAWMSVQIAERRYHLKSKRTIFLFECDSHKNQTIADLPTEWTKIGECVCSMEDMEPDVMIIPPNDGFLWDLAWNKHIQCYNSEMFKEFASLFVDKSVPDSPVGCFISRQDQPFRYVINYNEVIDMMYEVFATVYVLHFTTHDTIDYVVDRLHECKVLFGVHGAGHMNAIFARPGVAVVEMVGATGAQYYKNINMLLGQYYEAISGDKGKKMNGAFYVDLREAKNALERARDYALSWGKEHE